MTSAKKPHWLVLGSLFLVIAALLVACGDKESATEPVAAPNVSPDASNQQPDGAGGVALEIRDGAFATHDVRVQAGVPIILEVVNHDGKPYELKIEGLMASQSIGASDTTQIQFTTPNADTYKGQLLGTDNNVLDEFSLVVETAAGNAP